MPNICFVQDEPELIPARILNKDASWVFSSRSVPVRTVRERARVTKPVFNYTLSKVFSHFRVPIPNDGSLRRFPSCRFRELLFEVRNRIRHSGYLVRVQEPDFFSLLACFLPVGFLIVVSIYLTRLTDDPRQVAFVEIVLIDFLL